jgi:putative ABC transport system permease protein
MTNYLRALWAKLRGLFGDRRADREFDEEIETHLRLLTERYVRQGMTEAEAAWAARRQFGNTTLLQEVNRDMRGIRLLDTFFQDARYGLTMLRRNPGFTCVAALTLALGIGANTAIFSVVNAVLLRPLPYYDPQGLFWVTEGFQLFGEENTIDEHYFYWQAQSKSFDHLVAYHSGNLYLTGRGEPERLDYVEATANLFPALGVAPQLGRVFAPEEHQPGSAPVAILSHAFWQRRFGGDPAIIGQSVMLNGRSRQVIGVMPPGFNFIQKADVLLPLALELPSKGDLSITLKRILGRLKPGVTPEQARSELESIARAVGTVPRWGPLQVSVTPLGERLVGHLRRGLLVQFAAVAFILLIACANVANLILARSRVRQKEMAIRAAMGAGRGRLVRQMLTESLLLSIIGGVAGLLLALLGIKALSPLIPDGLSHLKESGPFLLVDGAALGFTFLASLLTGVIAGIIPALQTSQINLNESLKEGVRGAVFSMRKGARRVSPALVVGELALTLALLAGAGLLIKSFLRARAVEPGYNPRNLLTMTIPFSVARYTPAQKKIFFQDLLTRINSLPGVKIAAIDNHLPRANKGTVGGRAPLPDPKNISILEHHRVSVDYFRAMGMRLRAGRSFTEQDNENAAPVVVINETLARRDFPREDPIGKRRGNQQAAPTIIGVVADVKRYGLEAEARPEIYYPILQDAEVGGISLVVRAVGDPLNLAHAARRQVREIDANLPVMDVMSMEQRLAEYVEPRRFQTLLFGLFAALALVIATVGIYGVISYAVSQRMHEIGIRMALGAQAVDVLRMALWRGMSLALIGMALGLAAAFALTRVMKNLLFEVSATDPATFALIALLLVFVAMIASYIPARRATRCMYAAKTEPSLHSALGTHRRIGG